MKKITVLFIALAMLLSLAACSGKDEPEGSSNSEGGNGTDGNFRFC